MTPHEITVPPTCICGKPECKIPIGFCHCGCGGKTGIHTRSNLKAGQVRGIPERYLIGHQKRIRPVLESASPFKIEGVYCRMIPLTQGQYTIVDAADYEWLMQWKWCATWNSGTGSYYAKRKQFVDGKAVQFSMQRTILGLGPGHTLKGDHANGISLDNRRDNIRPATSPQNAQNRKRKLGKTNKSGFHGVHFLTEAQRWQAQIRVNGETVQLGRFDTPQEAYQIRRAAELRYFGEFAFRS